jgi:hypothetical protein
MLTTNHSRFLGISKGRLKDEVDALEEKVDDPELSRPDAREFAQMLEGKLRPIAN